MIKQKVIAIDFDGVCHDNKHPVKGRRMGGPIPGTKEALTGLRHKGYKIVIFTVWGGSEQGKKVIGDWMKYYEIPYDEITNIKPDALFYIDDRGVRFTKWDDLALKSLIGLK